MSWKNLEQKEFQHELLTAEQEAQLNREKEACYLVVVVSLLSVRAVHEQLARWQTAISRGELKWHDVTIGRSHRATLGQAITRPPGFYRRLERGFDPGDEEQTVWLERQLGSIVRLRFQLDCLYLLVAIVREHTVTAGTVKRERLTIQQARRLRRRLGQAIKRLEGIRSEFFCHNQRLVLHLVKRFAANGVPPADLIQEGRRGLLRAIEDYDHRRAKFSTAAYEWIRQSISRAMLQQQRLLTVPEHIARQRRRVNRCCQRYFAEHGSEPDLQTINEQTGIPLTNLPPVMLIDETEPLSLDKVWASGDEDGEPLGAFIPAEIPDDPIAVLERRWLRQRLEEALATLSKRQAMVIRLKYGLDTGDSVTLSEIGRRLGVSRERVRQIEAKALRRLQHPVRRRCIQGGRTWADWALLTQPPRANGRG